jgi:16S rRNA (guanine527-N7)-methyltransferase
MQALAKQASELLDLQLSKAQLDSLEIYRRELLKWNQRINLTAIRDAQGVNVKHFLDSLTSVKVMRDGPAGSRVVDIGAGAGFPGLPLKIVNPSLELTLVESVGKKVDFCRHIIATLALENVQVIQDRAENLGQDHRHRQRYDWAIARAVANLPVLVEYLLPFVKVGGTVVAMKGESGPAEAHQAEYATGLLGGHLRKLVPVTLPGVVEERYLVVIDKIAATPANYPRRVGIPAKRPLIAK